MTRPLLSLVVLVKNEAASVRALIESCSDTLEHSTILDTGSTDQTQNIVRELASEQDLLVEEPFIPYEKITDRKVIHYGKTRNRVLELEEAREDAAVFTLFLSGDETLVNGAALREFLETQRDATDGAYFVEIRDDQRAWPFPRVLRAGAGWEYKGAVHEVPVGPNGETTGPTIPGTYILHKVTDLARRQSRYREVDLPILTQTVEDDSHTVEERAQAMWHLAQTHEVIAEAFPRAPGSAWFSHKFSAMALYRRCADIEEYLAAKHGDDIRVVEDKFSFCMFRYLQVARLLDIYNDEEMLSRLEPLAELNPNMPELRYIIAACAAGIDVRKGAFLAREAVRVAREARENLSHVGANSHIEWMSLRLSAECAKTLSNDKQAREFAAAGIAAGGPSDAFAAYLA